MADEANSITLEDIEIMCRILEKFLRTAQRVERLLARVAPYRRYGPREDLWNMVMSSALQQVAASRGISITEGEEEEAFELTEREKAVIAKIRAGKAKKIQPSEVK